MLHVLGLGSSYGLQVGLARLMSGMEYGLYVYVQAWVAMGALVLTFGFPGVLLRFLPAYRALGQVSQARGLVRRTHQIVGGACVTVALLGSLLILLSGLPAEPTAAYLLGLWLLPLFGLNRVQTELLRAGHRVGWAYMPAFVQRLLIGGGVLLLLFTGLTPTASTVLAVSLIAGLLIWLLRFPPMAHTIPTATPLPAATYETRRWGRVAGPLLLSSLFFYASGQVDVLMLGLFEQHAAVGFYSAAARTATLGSLALTAANAVAAPQIAELHARRESLLLQRFVTRVSRLIFWPSLAVAAGLWGLGEPILSLFGTSFTAAVWPLRLLVLAHLIDALTGPVGYLLDLTGHHLASTHVYGWTALVNIVLNLVAIPTYGMLGAALATAASIALRNVWLYVLARRRLGIHASFLAAAT